jgi:hypothetical protein
MEKRWHILFCDAAVHICPVHDFLDSCQPADQVKILRILDLLEQMGPMLPRPYADLLRDGIHELRVHVGGEPIRLLYFFMFETYIIFYQALHKHTDRVPERVITETRTYRDDVARRLDRKHLEAVVHADL